MSVREQLSTGEREYAALFPELWQKAYLVAYKVLGSRAPAEDVAQETLARAYSWWSRIAKSPHGWVAKVAYGLAIDQVRRQRTARVALQDTSLQPAQQTRDARIEDRMDLMAAIERLPRRQRQVVILRYLGDQSEADTAAALGLRITTVRRDATRALSALGGHLVTEIQEG